MHSRLLEKEEEQEDVRRTRTEEDETGYDQQLLIPGSARAVATPSETVATLTMPQVKKRARERYSRRRRVLENFCNNEAEARGLEVLFSNQLYFYGAKLSIYGSK